LAALHQISVFVCKWYAGNVEVSESLVAPDSVLGDIDESQYLKPKKIHCKEISFFCRLL
jgi:hypothetical protein